MSDQPDDAGKQPQKQPQKQQKANRSRIPLTVPIMIGLTIEVDIKPGTPIKVKVAKINTAEKLGTLRVCFTSVSNSTYPADLPGQMIITAPGTNSFSFTITMPGPAPNVGFFTIMVLDLSDGKGVVNAYPVA